MEKLVLRNYNLIGTLSSSISRLNYLKRLVISRNNIFGTIPKELSLLSKMSRLGLGDNHLTGTIPSLFGQMINLQNLFLPSNYLTGTIPSQLGSMINLQDLDLSSNHLSGLIPSSLKQMSILKSLDLSSNHFTGTISSTFGELSILHTFTIKDNYVTGTIPSSLGKMISINILDLSDNDLTGTVPSTFDETINLQQLLLYSNYLTGTVPTSIGRASVIQFIGLGNINFDASTNSFVKTTDNLFTGQLPSSYCNYTSLLTFSMPWNNETCYPTCLYYKMNKNYLIATDHCPGNEDVTLCDMVKSTNMGDIVQSVINQLSQIVSSPHPIPAGYFSSQIVSVPDVVYYTISFTKTCSLPLSDVVKICLDSQKCPWILMCNSAPLILREPSFIVKYENKFKNNQYYGFELLIVATTKYKGWQCKPTQGALLNNYAPDYCSWTGILCVEGSVNQISLGGFGVTGRLPSSLSLLTNMQVLNLRYNIIKGTIPSTISTLSRLNNLDLSNNKLNGTIPQRMDLLTQLTAVNLASNRLTGRIPTSITSMKSLQSFSVNNNKLIGQITYPLCLLAVNVSLQVFGNSNIGCYQYCGSSSNSLQSQLPICSPTQSPTASPVANSQTNDIIVIVCSIGSALIVTFVIYYWYMRRKYSKIMFDNSEVERRRKQSLFVLPIHNFLILNSMDLKTDKSTNDGFIQELNLLIEKHEDSISSLDFDGRSVIDIVLMFYGDPFSDEVLLSVLRKW